MKSFRLLYGIFFLSGATGLVYEVIWVRLTGLVFGNTSHAIAVVLGAFMAGLALGSWRLGRRADVAARPLRMYGLLEMGIGLSAALVPTAFKSLDSLYWAIAPAIESVPAADGLIRFLTSFAILLIPTFLMGGTLPVLARFFAQAVSEVERKVAVLYALNTFGAAAGTLAAALFLIPTIGNTWTTLIIATLNLAIGAGAIWLDSHQETHEKEQTIEIPEKASLNPRSDRLVLLTLGASGLVSMFYEIAWTRALSAMIGSSTYAFSIMLVTFLVGIALGSAIVGKRRPNATLRTLGRLQLGVAAGGTIFLLGYTITPLILLTLMRAFNYSFPAVLTTQFICCAALMVLATLCMGATLPVATQMYSRKFNVLGRSIGNVYSVNTIGAITGSLIAGFVLLPWLGTERTIIAGLFLNSAVALVLLTENGSKGWNFGQWAALAFLVVSTLAMRGGLFWSPDMLDQGILIYARQFDVRPELTIAEHYADTDVAYFKEGNNATISVRRGENYIGLRTNGKVDASNKDDMQTQLLIGYLPVLYHPSPRSAMVIGYGSGVTVGAAASLNELQDIDCIEIEPAVVGAGPLFSDLNRKSFADPRVKVSYADARHVMNITRKQYDVIISEPSNPWIAGVASLFTSDFYERAARVLKPDGIFAQWVQLYELDPEDLRMILHEFQAKFPEISVWNTGGDLILIGTRQPQSLDMSRVARLLGADPLVGDGLRDYLGVTKPEGILAYYVMSSDGVRRFAQTDRRNSDDHPLLEFHAPRQLFLQTRELNVDLLYESKDGLIPPGAVMQDPEAVYGAVVEPFLATNRPNYANQAMAVLAQTPRKNDASLYNVLGRIDLDAGSFKNAEDSLQKASAAVGDSPLAGETEELWGLLYEKQGAPNQAIEHYKRAVAAEPSRPLSLRKLAELNAINKQWDEAASWMEKYITTRPLDLGHNWAILGDYYLAGKQIDQALRALQTAIATDPYSYWARYRLGTLFETKNEKAEAIKQYEFVIRYAYDRDPDIYVKLAGLYKAEGRMNDARSLMAKGFRMFSTNPEIYRLYREVHAGG
jgi:spermidine synthase